MQRGAFATLNLGLALLLPVIWIPGPASGAAEYPQVSVTTLAGAKVQLCKGFAEGTTGYYLRSKMPKEFDAYRKATEFEGEQKAALLGEASRRIRDESAAAFDPRVTYQVKDRAAYLSEFQRSPDGFRVQLPGSTMFHAGTIKLPNGRTERLNLPEIFGLKDMLDDTGVRRTVQPSLWGHTVVGLDAEGNPVPQMKYEVRSRVETRRSGTPFVRLAYGLMPADRQTLQLQAADSTVIFVPVPEAQARKIAEIYRGQKGGMRSRTTSCRFRNVCRTLPAPTRSWHASWVSRFMPQSSKRAFLRRSPAGSARP